MNFYKLGQGKQAYKALDEGKAISLKPSSLRYSYEEGEDSNIQKTWKPKTAEEKKILSPKNYFRVGERDSEKESRYKSIFESALANAKKEHAEKVDIAFKDELAKATEKQNKKFFGLGKIFTTAKKRALIEKAAKEKAESSVKDTSEETAKKKADEQFKDQYSETQISVPSTAIADIRYNPKSEGLNVKFQGGKTSYFYPRVPLELIQRWMKAPSKGEFFMRNIHDQYSIFGKNHRKKSDSQHKGMRVYEKSYKAKNKNHKVGN